MLKPEEDAYGQGMYDCFCGKETLEIVERDDGYIDASRPGQEYYFAPFQKWPRVERQAIRFARGRVLDVGCGAGRVGLYLQEKGCEVVGIDYSPMLVELSRQRGMRDVRLMRFLDVSAEMGVFDTVVMFGNNFGLFESPRKATVMLKRLYGMMSARGRVIASVVNPYKTREPLHLEYHERNRKRGRTGGQLRLRIRHKKLKTPWFDYLFVSPEELREIVHGTGWEVHRLFEVDSSWPIYSMVLTRAAHQSARRAGSKA